VTVLLVRHARAGRRQDWDGDDVLRPLSVRGQQQAKALPDVLTPLLGKQKRPVVVMSSPWVRCVATVAPLCETLGLDVVEEPALGEGHDEDAIALVARLCDRTAVVCTHGDVIERVLAWLRRGGVDLGRRPSFPKGSTWALQSRSGRFHVARYLPPPT
jgi:broad specificity phosphatase PhoE